MLFHVSEQSGIDRFEPRRVETFEDPVVWAIDQAHLRNYLLPRQCPRVTYYASPKSTTEDIVKYLGASAAVVAIESAWLERVKACRLYCYRMPPDTFECIDEGAGYFVSRQSVVPIGVEIIQDLISALALTGAELRVVDSLWPLHDAIAASTLQFSMIRMRNARVSDAT